MKTNAVLEDLEPKKYLCLPTTLGDIIFQLTHFS